MSNITDDPSQPNRPRVLKFGGSTLARPHALANAVGLVLETSASAPVAVVVSAVGHTTDRLLELASYAAQGELAKASAITDACIRTVLDAHAAVSAGADVAALERFHDAVNRRAREIERLTRAIAELGDCPPAARDRLLGFGELLALELMTELLRLRGSHPVAVDARQWVVTDDAFGHAEVLWEPTRERLAALFATIDPRATTVHTGFLGSTIDGRPTTLGRNGSDYTATLLARALGASDVTIWTDVSGVMTADPSLVDEAYPVPSLSYREALELAGLGLRMLHSRTMVPLLAEGIPMRIRNSGSPADIGTVVDGSGSVDPRRPTCVVSLESGVLVSIEGTHRTASAGLGRRVLDALAAARIEPWLTTYGGNGIAYVVGQHEGETTLAVVRDALARELARGDLDPPEARAPVSVVTLVAEAMGKTPRVAGRFFGALGEIGVNVLAATQGATSRAISCVVDGADTTAAVRAVHAAFNLSREQVSLLLLGKGVVGSQLLAVLAAECDKLREAHAVDVKLAGVVDRRASIFSERGIAPDDALTALARSAAAPDIESMLHRLAKMPSPVLIDCTASDEMSRVYERALDLGIHVVAANKKPFAAPTAEREALFAKADLAHRRVAYETTVGASLPVIETLKNLMRTGDRIRLIEGSLSGTLGFLANVVSRGEKLSSAVRRAHKAGYTEPHPREDLSGLDAARKALILARELGLRLDLDQVVVEPFVPARLLKEDDLAAFFRGLEAHDETFGARVDGLVREGRVLRYLAQIRPGADGRGAVRVAPVSVDASHPASRLRGTEALVAFHTERYADDPLIVQGAGAGGAVTAAGVLADVLSLSQTMRHR